MKSKIFVLVLAAAMLLAAPFVIKGPDGKPMASLDRAKQIFMDGVAPVAELTDTVASKVEASFGDNSDAASSSKIYRWQDATGSWHFGDAPPTDNNTVQALEVETNANIIPAYKAPEASTASGTDLGDALNIGKTLQDGIDARDAATRAAMKQAEL